jgi:CDP-paratose 2-epimerase
MWFKEKSKFCNTQKKNLKTIMHSSISYMQLLGEAIMKALITGGAGFVGSNVAGFLLNKGYEVAIYDNLARGLSCEYNISWLRSNHNTKRLTVIKGDVRDYECLARAAKDSELIIHTAAQVSVPRSIEDPRADFEVNVLGTFNILEVARNCNLTPFMIYTSSNKVYGIPNSELIELEKRYDFKDLSEGVNEMHPLKGEEPYGVSKAIGDHYLRAYCLLYGLKGISVRCSCMYGPGQWGKEEQGWVAWFCIAFALGHPITIYGDGKQVRDLLYIDNVISAFGKAIQKANELKGEAVNLGGGKRNAVSLLDVIEYLEKLTGKRVERRFTNWRQRDNKCYYTNYSKAEKLLGWKPSVPFKEGIARTYEWIQTNLTTIKTVYGVH